MSRTDIRSVRERERTASSNLVSFSLSCSSRRFEPAAAAASGKEEPSTAATATADGPQAAATTTCGPQAVHESVFQTPATAAAATTAAVDEVVPHEADGCGGSVAPTPAAAAGAPSSSPAAPAEAAATAAASSPPTPAAAATDPASAVVLVHLPLSADPSRAAAPSDAPARAGRVLQDDEADPGGGGGSGCGRQRRQRRLPRLCRPPMQQQRGGLFLRRMEQGKHGRDEVALRRNWRQKKKKNTY